MTGPDPDRDAPRRAGSVSVSGACVLSSGRPGRRYPGVRRVSSVPAVPGPGRPEPGRCSMGAFLSRGASARRSGGGSPGARRRTGPVSPPAPPVTSGRRPAPARWDIEPARTGTMEHRAGPGRPGAGPPRGHLRGRRRQGHEALPRGTHLMLTPKEKCTRPGPSQALPSATGGGLAPETTHVRLCRRARTRHHSPMLPPFSSAIPLTRFLLLSVDDEGAKGRRRTTGSADAFR